MSKKGVRSVPRMRYIKPEIRRSLTVSAWPFVVRWTFVGLFGYLDDQGRGVDDPRLLKAELYPLDENMTARKINTHLDRIAKSGPLCRYIVDSRHFMHITTWGEHQHINRPTRSRIPACPLHEPSLSASGSPHGGLTEDSRRTHGGLTATGGKPQGGLTEGSLPRAQARVPEDQGTGNREQGTTTSGDAVARRENSTAQTILGEWLDRCTKRPPGAVVGRVGKATKALLAEGVDPDDVRRGLVAWQAKGLDPSALPSVINQVMNAGPRESTTDQRVAAALTLARRFATEEAL